MNANLEDFIDGETSTEENDEDADSDADQRKSADDINISVKPHGVAPHDQERNICPSCMHVSPNNDGFGWKCLNPECGVKLFGSGWYQQRKEEWGRDDDFLDSIDWVKLMEKLHSKGIGTPMKMIQ